MCEILPVDKRKNRERIKDTRVFNVLRVVQEDDMYQSACQGRVAPAMTTTTAGREKKDVTRNIPACGWVQGAGSLQATDLQAQGFPRSLL